MIFVAEGEKDVDRLWQLALPATCNPGGAGDDKWKPEFSRSLRDRHVAIVPDNDNAGRDHAQQVANSLHGIAATVRIVELPNLPEGGDASDWFDGGGTAEQLRHMAEIAPLFNLESTGRRSSDVPTVADSDLEERPLADPHRIAEQILQRHRHVSNPQIPTLRFYRDEILKWSENRYQPFTDKEFKAIVSAATRRILDTVEQGSEISVTTNLTANIVEAIHGLTLVSSTIRQPAWLLENPELPPANEILVARNGLIHLPALVDGSDQFEMPPTPAFFSPTALDYDFAIDAPSPERWLEFLQSLWPDDQESIDTLAEIFGYCLLPDTSQHKIFLLVGPPRSGKGTIGRIFRQLIGKHNLEATTFQRLRGEFGLSPLIGSPR